jgi:hypothetical protein
MHSPVRPLRPALERAGVPFREKAYLALSKAGLASIARPGAGRAHFGCSEPEAPSEKPSSQLEQTFPSELWLPLKGPGHSFGQPITTLPNAKLKW